MQFRLDSFKNWIVYTKDNKENLSKDYVTLGLCIGQWMGQQSKSARLVVATSNPLPILGLDSSLSSSASPQNYPKFAFSP
jgi:hypothetical protein